MYFISTIRIAGDNQLDDCRTVGYYKSYRDAFDVCMENRCDIFEDGFYQYAIITFVEEGLYPSKKTQLWVTFDKKNSIISHSLQIPKGLEEIDKNLYIIG